MRMRFRATGEDVEVYAVHKSGPANDGSQTKFLVCPLGHWLWMLCDNFIAPMFSAEREVPKTTIISKDLLVGPPTSEDLLL
jgi:hypothetical protein